MIPLRRTLLLAAAVLAAIILAAGSVDWAPPTAADACTYCDRKAVRRYTVAGEAEPVTFVCATHRDTEAGYMAAYGLTAEEAGAYCGRWTAYE